ncbi:hypothetical protein L2E82_48473 [Cichorium intybus]|uniref:Uncharacterized protein n=1 Tax=Cichorium intybus TaxID=13427 RepID=A0ACB8YYS8_CICIN|nr:hypothetical protein L2E82_48473 [Cichorium intybus]
MSKVIRDLHGSCKYNTGRVSLQTKTQMHTVSYTGRVNLTRAVLRAELLLKADFPFIWDKTHFEPNPLQTLKIDSKPFKSRFKPNIHELKLGIYTWSLKAKARQDQARDSGVPRTESTSGSGNVDHGKRITEG